MTEYAEDADYNIAHGSKAGSKCHWWSRGDKAACGRVITPWDNVWVGRTRALEEVDCTGCHTALEAAA